MTIGPSSAASEMSAIHKAAFHAGWSAEAVTSILASPGAFALADQPMTGFILARVVADEGEVLTVAVTPDGRHLGLGRRLLRGAETRVALAGGRTLFLEVASDNAPAIGLYRSAGFEDAGRRRGYYLRPGGQAADALILRKPLAPPT